MALQGMKQSNFGQSMPGCGQHFWRTPAHRRSEHLQFASLVPHSSMQGGISIFENNERF
jgi:hypothetical protein